MIRQKIGLAASVCVGVVVLIWYWNAVKSNRSAALHNLSMGRMKLINLAMLSYENSQGAFPPRAIFDKSGKPLLSWRVQILPYIEEARLYEEFHRDEPWDSDHNKKLIPRMPKIYAAPDSKAAKVPGKAPQPLAAK